MRVFSRPFDTPVWRRAFTVRLPFGLVLAAGTEWAGGGPAAAPEEMVASNASSVRLVVTDAAQVNVRNTEGFEL